MRGIAVILLLLIPYSNNFIAYTFHDLGIPTILIESMGSEIVTANFSSPYIGKALVNITLVWSGEGLSVWVSIEINDDNKFISLKEVPEIVSMETKLRKNNSFKLAINVIGIGRFTLFNNSTLTIIPIQEHSGVEVNSSSPLFYVTISSIVVPVVIRILQIVKSREGIIIVEDKE